MTDFCQTMTNVTTLHILSADTVHLRAEIKKQSARRKAALVVPCLASEFTDPQNRPVFQKIISELSKVDYLEWIIFGLDQATAEQALMARDLMDQAGLTNYLIQWNDGPEFGRIYDLMGRAQLEIDKPGKGRNVFLSMGLALALGADCVGLIDADIKTFTRSQLDRLFYPVMVLDHDFTKAYYSRVHDHKLYGRIKRLLVDPLLLTLKRKFSYSKEDKFIRIIDYLLSFRYQLSGEVAFDSRLLRRMRFATNWGLEIYTLIEAFRKANSICQVQFSADVFDHKHQQIEINQPDCGLHGMAREIINTLMNALVAEEGLEVTRAFFRDLAVTYQAVADQLIKKYSHEAAFNNLEYDRDEEEAWVRDIFRSALIAIGEQIESPVRISEMLLYHLQSNKEYGSFLKYGLDQVVLNMAAQSPVNLFEVPQTVSWERAEFKLPDIRSRLLEAAAEARARFA